MAERLTARRLVAFATALFCVLFLFYSKYRHSNNKYPGTTAEASKDLYFPRKIWQKWETSAQGLEDELQRFARSWANMNPRYRYELLTSDSALSYVRERFSHRQDIVQIYEKTEDKILRADLIRYLVLLADGGVYTDIDTHCSKPIDDWIPSEYVGSANLVVGLEYDAQGGEVRGDFTLPTQLCQWTFMSRAGSPALQRVVDEVIKALDDLYKSDKGTSSLSLPQVQDTTGPHVSRSW